MVDTLYKMFMFLYCGTSALPIDYIYVLAITSTSALPLLKSILIGTTNEGC
jgi:hypothetical protein